MCQLIIQKHQNEAIGCFYVNRAYEHISESDTTEAEANNTQQTANIIPLNTEIEASSYNDDIQSTWKMIEITSSRFCENFSKLHIFFFSQYQKFSIGFNSEL